MKLRITSLGDAEVKRRIARLGEKALDRTDKVSETYARKMANESASKAPVLDNILAPSIAASPKKIRDGEWSYGSNVEYALVQEYENPTKKGFIRTVVWDNREPYREALKKAVLDDG